MKKILESKVFIFVLGVVIAGSVGVYAGNQILASDVDYKDGKKVSQALDELYIKTFQNRNVTVLAALTDNFVQPSSKSFNTTISEDGILLVDMGAVDGNNSLQSKWNYSVKKNNVSIEYTGGYANGYNGHYYWIINVNKDDLIETSTTVNYNGVNYNAVTLSVYFIK